MPLAHAHKQDHANKSNPITTNKATSLQLIETLQNKANNYQIYYEKSYSHDMKKPSCDIFFFFKL